MKFKVEVELDWIREDETIDSEVQDLIVSSIVSKLSSILTKSMTEEMVATAKGLMTAKTESLIHGLLEKPVVISNGWNDKKEFDSIYDMVEEKMTDLYTGKLGDKNQCKKDPLLGQIESYVKNYYDNSLDSLRGHVKKIARESAEAQLEKNEFVNAIKSVVNSK